VIQHTPEIYSACRANLVDSPLSPELKKRQVFDIPEPKIFVTEHPALIKRCQCSCETKATFPEDVAPVQ
jgi:transposase